MLYLLSALCLLQPNQPPPILPEATRMMKYYEKPDPRRGVKLLKELLKPENLDHPMTTREDGHVLSILCEQLGYIAKGHPEIVREYEKLFANTTPTGKYGILRTLRVAGDDQTKKQLDTWLAGEKNPETLKALEETKRIITAPKREMNRDRAVRTGKDLDMLWADFFATGEYTPVSRILDAFESNVPPGVKSAARWSLESNLKQHPKLVKLVKEHLKDRGEKSKAEAEKILEKMENDSGT